DVFVCEAIKRHKALFAMETSAHYFLPSFYIFDDPVLMTLQLTEILAKGKERLSELVDAIPSYPTLTENLQCPDEVKFQVMEGIIKGCKAKGYRLDLTDGVKLLFDDGWALLRPSNTNPLIRAAVEAETEERAEALLALVKKEFRRALEKKKG
ncbi:MAG: phosphomannomutase, partial [Euryarchaeota archaeon]|nr:phosphomannomutase [Euryarchaeota archaeon]